MAHLIWSPQALRDLDDICAYIARNSSEYARVVASRIVETVEILRAHPLLGSMVAEYQQDDLRERRFQSSTAQKRTPWSS